MINKTLEVLACTWLAFSSAVMMVMIIAELASTFGGSAAFVVMAVTALASLYLKARL